MGSALFLSGVLHDFIGWRGTWLAAAALLGIAAVALVLSRRYFLRVSALRQNA